MIINQKANFSTFPIHRDEVILRASTQSLEFQTKVIEILSLDDRKMFLATINTKDKNDLEIYYPNSSSPFADISEKSWASFYRALLNSNSVIKMPSEWGDLVSRAVENTAKAAMSTGLYIY